MSKDDAVVLSSSTESSGSFEHSFTCKTLAKRSTQLYTDVLARHCLEENDRAYVRHYFVVKLNKYSYIQAIQVVNYSHIVCMWLSRRVST